MKGTYMICADGIYLLDLLAEGHCFVDDELQEVVRRGLAREELKLAVDRARPRDNDSRGDLRRRSSVSPTVLSQRAWRGKGEEGEKASKEKATRATHDDRSHRV